MATTRKENTILEKITVSEVAKALGVSALTVRAGLIQEKFPFGVAIKRKQWTFIISREKFMEYIGKPMNSSQ